MLNASGVYYAGGQSRGNLCAKHPETLKPTSEQGYFSRAVDLLNVAFSSVFGLGAMKASGEPVAERSFMDVCTWYSDFRAAL